MRIVAVGGVCSRTWSFVCSSRSGRRPGALLSPPAAGTAPPQIPCKRSGESKLQSCCAKSRTVPPRQNLARRAAPADFAHKLLLLCWNLLEKAKKESEIYLRGGQNQGFGGFVLCLATMSPLSRKPTLPIKKCTIYVNW